MSMGPAVRKQGRRQYGITRAIRKAHRVRWSRLTLESDEEDKGDGGEFTENASIGFGGCLKQDACPPTRNQKEG